MMPTTQATYDCVPRNLLDWCFGNQFLKNLKIFICKHKMLRSLFEAITVAITTFLCGLSVVYFQLTRQEISLSKTLIPLAYIINLSPDDILKGLTRNILDCDHKLAFQFRRGYGMLTSNLYRIYGYLDSSHSDVSVSIFRSVIGNSGYIELFFGQTLKGELVSLPKGLLLNHSKMPCESLVLRVFVSAKIHSREFEIEINRGRERFLWNAAESNLYLLRGVRKVLAVTAEIDKTETRLFVEKSIISPLIAVCLFFL